ncbi:hypothetical protein [Sphingobium sp. S6]|nr:hypothetical protein [Sphingobium sp. S6]
MLLMHGVREEEKEIARAITSNLNALSTEANNIAAAVALFGLCAGKQERGLWQDWMRVAARDGAMSIRNFGEALAKIRGLIGKVPTWCSVVDTKALKSAETTFKETFPFAYKMRHSVAHPELYNDPSKKMGISGSMDELGIRANDVTNLSIQGLITGVTFASTFEGVLVRYDVSAESLSAIIDITNTCFSSFQRLEGFRREVR